ncbi:MAG: cytochrome c-type biogenesis protein CcmH [Actinomycetia bacterium]|nr:cytochrome c-type biogenesis protein CcmH [Actinomycetes bacterium]MCP3912801.1 cytochrome c-type biogenesis protein CcmH [Actinomycetes bacterium]MCP4085864.1 cytochrome c-type biogenesis protein CcmH [Actinomycetes bacterium]
MADNHLRPAPLVVGSVFTLVGALAVASDLTTLDSAWILPVALTVAGLAGLILVVRRSRAAADHE